MPHLPTVSQPSTGGSCGGGCRVRLSTWAGGCLKRCTAHWHAGMAKGGCCAVLHLREDNARFILLAMVMVLYMLSGATIFMFLERDREVEDRNKYYHVLDTFLNNNPQVNTTELDELLRKHAEASSAGILEGRRKRWDFPGAFYFVGTVVSTIGKNQTRITSKFQTGGGVWWRETSCNAL